MPVKFRVSAALV